MKKISILLALVMVLSLFGTAAFADAQPEEPAAEETEVIAAEAAPKGAPEVDPFCGIWYGYKYTGVYDLSIDGFGLLVLPGRIMVSDDLTLPLEMISDTEFVISGLEESTGIAGITLQGEYGLLTREEIEEFGVEEDAGYVETEEGSPRIIVTVSADDPSNPLSTSTISARTLVLRTVSQYEYFSLLMRDRTWKIDERVLAIDSEGALDLDNGAFTGSAYWSDSEDAFAEVEFIWDGGGVIDYAITYFDEGSIVLENVDNPDEVLKLEVADTAAVSVAEEPAAETAGE